MAALSAFCVLEHDLELVKASPVEKPLNNYDIHYWFLVFWLAHIDVFERYCQYYCALRMMTVAYHCPKNLCLNMENSQIDQTSAKSYYWKWLMGTIEMNKRMVKQL